MQMRLSKGRLLCLAIGMALVSVAGVLYMRGGGNVIFRRSQIDVIARGLQSRDDKQRKAAEKQLDELGKDGLSVEDGKKALAAATGKFPPPEYSFFSDGAGNLILAAAEKPYPEYIPLAVQIYPQLSAQGKLAALNLLSRMPEKDAAAAYMEILRKHARTGGVPEIFTFFLHQQPRHPDVFFPEMLEYADDPALGPDIYNLWLTYCRAGLVPTDGLLPFTEQILAAYRPVQTSLLAAQQPAGVGWMWEADYQKARQEGGLLLDLMGYLPVPAVKQELHQALNYTDPRLKYFAVISQLRLQEPVDPTQIQGVAASAEMREFLFNELVAMGQVSMYPRQYLTQEAFAESDMVSWLTFGTELGRVPDEIELMKVVSVDAGEPDGILDYYIFRFRTLPPHWAASDGWMAGVSGPFLRKDAPSTKSYGETFSAFEAWDSKAPEEHLGNVQDILERWREYQATKNK